jgi:ABC-type branched-subunit amino acid transport system ATPase component
VSGSVLSIEGLTAGYDGAAVVRELDLEVGAGEVVALLGPNGAGKTTTLRAISGLVRPLAGAIRVHGDDVAKRSPTARARMGIAHVPEGRGVFFGLTVAEHLRLGHPGERLDAAIAYTYFPALERLADRRAGLLSGGEQQMLALGRALARRPTLLLLDEMSLGLAPVIVEHLMPVVSTYAHESGCAVLLVEQHIHIALSVADRGYVLSHGELVVHERAEVLRDDHQLVLSSYLGEHTVEPGDDPPA